MGEGTPNRIMPHPPLTSLRGVPDDQGPGLRTIAEPAVRRVAVPVADMTALDDDLASLEKRLEEGNLKPSDTGLLRMSVAHIHRRLVSILDAAPSA